MKKVTVKSLSEFFNAKEKEEFIEQFKQASPTKLPPLPSQCFHTAKVLLLRFHADKYVLGIYRYEGRDLEHAWNKFKNEYVDADPNLGVNRGIHLVKYELTLEEFLEVLKNKYPNDFLEINKGNKVFDDISIDDVQRYLPNIQEIF